MGACSPSRMLPLCLLFSYVCTCHGGNSNCILTYCRHRVLSVSRAPPPVFLCFTCTYASYIHISYVDTPIFHMYIIICTYFICIYAYIHISYVYMRVYI